MHKFSVWVKSTRGIKESVRVLEVTLSAPSHNSPFVLGLTRLETESRFNPPAATYVYRLKNTLQFLSVSIPNLIQLPISKYSRDSFDDLLYTIDQALEKSSVSIVEKVARSNVVRWLLGKNDLPLQDGTEIRACLSHYVSILKNKASLSSTLQAVSTITHQDLSDLEAKAKFITQDRLNIILQACKSDIDSYLNTCRKQSNFARYTIKDGVRKEIFKQFIKGAFTRNSTKYRKVDTLKSLFRFLAEQEKYEFRNYGFFIPFPSTKNGFNLNGTLSQYFYGKGYQPWFYSQYRLPNFILTSCYILLLVKTGWNMGSVAFLNTTNIKLLPNGTYEIQSPKHKTSDETPKFFVSKADKYLKICLSLLIWNRSQLVKFGLINSSDEGIWNGWQRNQETPFHPASDSTVKKFFDRHKIQKIPLSHIRPIKAASVFLNHNDMELVRMMLGHSCLDTTTHYLQNNLIFHLNESRILEFQKRLENTIAHGSFSHLDFIDNGFEAKKVELTLISRTLTADTSIESKFIEEAHSFLREIGIVSFDSKTIVSADSITQSLLLRNYYTLRWRQLFDKNPDYFIKNHLSKIIYTDIFLKIAKQRRPVFFEKTIKNLHSRGMPQ